MTFENVKQFIKKYEFITQIGGVKMSKLPQKGFFEGFYIWFDKDKKEEYYGTPLYLYNTLRNDDFPNRRQTLYLEKDTLKVKPSKKEEILKHPGFLCISYAEKFGMMLMRFLNADLSSFETAYNDFFFAYGFELLKEYAPYDGFKGKYASEIEFVEMIKKVYEICSYNLKEIQRNYRECVDLIYNLNGNEVATTSSAIAKFAAYMIERQNEIGSYSGYIDVFLDNYAQQDLDDYAGKPYESIIEKIENGELLIKKHNVYTSERLTNILYVVLEQIAEAENLPIKKCQICGKYFIPTSRQDEIYCDFPDYDGKSCREKGARLTYKKNLENVPALLEYRKSYQKKIMVVSRNKENKKLKQDFDKWKKQAQEKIRKFKKGELSEEELYKWMMENK